MRCFFSFLFATVLLIAAAIIGSAQAAPRFEIKQLVMEEAAQSDVPISLALAVAKVESDFNPKALSSKGARGVMQIMPQTARGEFGISAEKLWDARTNVRLGIRFLERLYDQYDQDWELALSHYNGGTISNAKPHVYTRKYIQKVSKWQRIYQEQASLWAHHQEDSSLDEDLDVAQWSPRHEPFQVWVEVEDSEDLWEEDLEVAQTDYSNFRRWAPPPRLRPRFGHRPARPFGHRRPRFH